MPYRTDLKYANRHQTGVGKVRDISFDGLFIETPLALAVGDEIAMDFRFRHTTANVAIAGEIRRITPQGVGVRLKW
jgi:Tfp pilus assembly protein PilZ